MQIKSSLEDMARLTRKLLWIQLYAEIPFSHCAAEIGCRKTISTRQDIFEVILLGGHDEQDLPQTGIVLVSERGSVTAS